jgi:hypothetical protein
MINRCLSSTSGTEFQPETKKLVSLAWRRRPVLSVDRFGMFEGLESIRSLIEVLSISAFEEISLV